MSVFASSIGTSLVCFIENNHLQAKATLTLFRYNEEWEWCPGTIVDEARTSLFGETVVLWTIRYDSKFGGKVSAKPCAVQIAVT